MFSHFELELTSVCSLCFNTNFSLSYLLNLPSIVEIPKKGGSNVSKPLLFLYTRILYANVYSMTIQCSYVHTHSCVFFDNLIQGFLLRWTFYSHCDVQRTICFRHGMTGGCFRSKVYTAGLSYSLELKCCRPHTPFWLVVLAVYRR